MASRCRPLSVVALIVLALHPTARAAAPDPQALPDADALEQQFRLVAERVAPAVVAISASSEANDNPASRRTAELNSDKLQAFLARTTRVVGTGFVLSADGYVLTNDHVIDDAEQLWVTMDDRRVYPAVVVGTDPRSDLAVLKIPGRGLPAVRLGDGGRARRGQWSIAIGNPYGLSADGGLCVSVGVLSAVHRSLPKLTERENRLYCDLLQTTAQINPGNSGGPLFDLRGDVIGVNTAVVLPQHTAAGGPLNGIGFAIPVDARLRDIVAHLMRGDELPYGYLGVIVSNPTDHDRESTGLADAAGVCVDEVRPDSPAVRVLRPGDVITALADRPVVDSGDFVRLVGCTPTDRPVTVSLLRDGRATTATVRLRRRPLPAAAVTRSTQRLRWGGMLVVADPAGGLKVTHVDPAGPFAAVHEGALLRTVAGRRVRSVVELQDVINDCPLAQCALGVTDQSSVDATASIHE